MMLRLNDNDRQVVLMALAHLSVERPGWDDMLHTLALQIDVQRDGRALLYDEFREMRRQHLSGSTVVQCKLCRQPAEQSIGLGGILQHSDYCERHRDGKPLPEDYREPK